MNETADSRWTDIGDGVLVRQSVRYAMNSVVLLDEEHTLLVDPGILPSEIDDIAAVVEAANPAAITIIFTHPHWDHVLGRAWWPKAETLAHDAFPDAVKADLAYIRSEADRIAGESSERWARSFEPFPLQHFVSGLNFRKFGPWRIVLRSAPGHCATQLNVHLPEQRVLIAADMLSDIEIPALETAPEVYRGTLDALMPIVEGGAIETIVPGHGTIAHGRDQVLARFYADLDYLDTIERGVHGAWLGGLSAEATANKLETMEYLGKHATEYPTAEIHRENVLHAFHAAAAAAADDGGSSRS